VLDLYNLQIANGRDFPTVPQSALPLLVGSIVFGSPSIALQRNEPVSKEFIYNARTVAVSSHFPLMGLTLPLSMAEEMNKKSGNPKPPKLFRIHGSASGASGLQSIERMFAAHKVSTALSRAQERQERVLMSRFFLFLQGIIGIVLFGHMVFFVSTVQQAYTPIMRFLVIHGASKWQLQGVVLLHISGILAFVSGVVLVVGW
jgi:hypothetical protein